MYTTTKLSQCTSSVPLGDLLEVEDGLVVFNNRPYRGGKFDVETLETLLS